MTQAISWYEDVYCYYFWKPHGIASSFGQWPCFLDVFKNIWSIQDTTLRQCMEHLDKTFGAENEYGLLNRLDNDTWWLLYFAKTKSIKDTRKDLQKKWLITKYYIADVTGDVWRNNKVVAYPIIHHPQSPDRMVCISNTDTNIYATNTKKLYCETWIEKLYYDREKNYSCLLIYIQKWVRHQIRCHLSAIWCPIIWEKIYKKKKDAQLLHLWSIGVRV